MKKILFIALVISSISVLASPKGGAYLDPKEAGLDFIVQGEYTGEDTEGGRVGLNIIARGDGKYEGKGFMGGLPGDGWDPYSETLPLTIETNPGIGGEYSGEDAEGQKVGLKISSIGAGKFKGEGLAEVCLMMVGIREIRFLWKSRRMEINGSLLTQILTSTR